MYTSYSVTLLALASSVLARNCVNLTIPINISARNGVFDIKVPQTNLDATAFIQNVTQQGRNFTETALTGYATVSGSYDISAQYCEPSEAQNESTSTVQVLIHGIGFDKTYWDNPYNAFNYSYVAVATDNYKFCTFAIDRLGIGMSSHGEPLNEIQAFLEVAALAELTTMLREGTMPGISRTFNKVTHVGHSFGSGQTYALVNMYPNISDGIILTGFSMNGSFLPFFSAGADFVQANLNQPFRFGNASAEDFAPLLSAIEQAAGISASSPAVQDFINAYSLTDYAAGLTAPLPRVPYVNAYLANKDVSSQQYLFFQPERFDNGILFAGEQAKQPVTVGELLTLGSLPMTNNFAGPVLVLTGSSDLPFCGGDCFATGDPAVPSIPAAAIKSFPNVPAGKFEAYIQPMTAHGLNFHYNQTGVFKVANDFLCSMGL